MIDVERVRADTPGVAHVAHLNNAGSSLPPRQVHDAVVAHLEREAEIGGYEAARERKDAWEHTYDALARLLNAHRDEIAVIENATRAWDMAFYAFRFGPGDRILTGNAEYASNWIALKQVTDRTGARIEVVPDDVHGQIDVDALEGMLDDDVKLVREARLARARPDAERPRQPGGRGRAGDPRGGRAPPARRMPVSRAAAGRRRGDRLRHPLRHRPEVPPRSTRHRLPVRPP
jgi:hypothetical protein